MSIVQYTEQEQRLTNTLRLTTEALRSVTAERDALKNELALWANPNRSVIREMAALIQERDALQADAERYRFIHTRPEWLGWDEDFDHRDIDAIVDRAMKGES